MELQHASVGDDRLLGLVETGVITEEQAHRVTLALGAANSQSGLTATSAEPAANLRSKFAEIAGYVGGALVIGAAVLLLGQNWEQLGQTGRVAVLGVAALMMAVAGFAIANSAAGPLSALRTPDADHTRRRLASVVLCGAALAAGFAASQIPSTDNAFLVGAATCLLLSIAGYLVAPSMAGQAAVALSAMATIFAVIEQAAMSPNDLIATALSFTALATVWAALTARGAWVEQRFAVGVAAGIAFYAGQILYWSEQGSSNMWMWVGLAITALVATACFAAYTRLASWPLLAVGVLSTTFLVPEVLTELTDGSLGSSGVMLVSGLTLLGASAFSLRMHNAGGEDQTSSPTDAAPPSQLG